MNWKVLLSINPCLIYDFFCLIIIYSFTDQRDSENVSDNDLSSDSDSEESRLTEDFDEEELAVVRLSWKPSGGPVSLGEWEQHTKVIDKTSHQLP